MIGNCDVDLFIYHYSSHSPLMRYTQIIVISLNVKHKWKLTREFNNLFISKAPNHDTNYDSGYNEEFFTLIF